jgi:CheY-like chemotaxis protein
MQPGTLILLVEDNPENLTLLRAYLNNPSFKLHFASNGLEALEKRQKDNYDLVFMDIQMPGMDGHTAAREIRAWEQANRMPRVPIVALTANVLSGAAANSMAAGCDEHLTKPVTRSELVAAILQFARPSGGRVEAISAQIAARRPAFLANRKLDLARMTDALSAFDFATIQHVSHNCKGIGTGYGFPDISSIGSDLEIAARALDAAEVEKAIRQFELCLQEAPNAPSEP